MNPYEDYKEKINLANQFILTFDKQLRFKKSCNRQSVLPHTSSERQIWKNKVRLRHSLCNMRNAHAPYSWLVTARGLIIAYIAFWDTASYAWKFSVLQRV